MDCLILALQLLGWHINSQELCFEITNFINNGATNGNMRACCHCKSLTLRHSHDGLPQISKITAPAHDGNTATRQVRAAGSIYGSPKENRAASMPDFAQSKRRLVGCNLHSARKLDWLVTKPLNQSDGCIPPTRLGAYGVWQASRQVASTSSTFWSGALSKEK